MPPGPSHTDIQTGSFRLTADFPQRFRLRRILLQSKGLNDSDVRIFEHILRRTVFSPEHRALAPLSLSQIATNCGVSRSTAIRSIRRLQEQELVVTIQDEEWWRHRESHVGPAPKLIERVPSSGGISAVGATRSASIRSGLHNLDCFDGFPRIEASSVHLVLTDLPTGETENDWDVPLDLDAFWREVKRVLRADGTAVIFAHSRYNHLLAMSNWGWLKYDLIWLKEQTGFWNAKYAPLRAHETILVFAPGTPVYNPQVTSGGKPYRKRRKPTASTNYGGSNKWTLTINNGGRYITSVLPFKRDRGNPHPTAKPVGLLELLVRSYSNPGDLVCDPCAGSWSSAIAAMNASRQFVGFERDKAMFERAAKRIREHGRRLSDGEVTG